MNALVPHSQRHNPSSELLTCRVGNQWLGLQVQQVREIVMAQACTQVPLAPDSVAGLINLRGKVMTQIELRAIMGLPKRGEDEAYHVAIIETLGGEDFGLMVDEVGEVASMDYEQFEATPRSLAPIWKKVSNGVMKQQGRILVLVDVEKLIALTIPASQQFDLESQTIH